MKRITGHLAEKNGRWYAVINLYDADGKRREKWRSLDLEAKKGTKTEANHRMNEVLEQYNLGDQYLHEGMSRADRERNRIADMRVEDYLAEWLESYKGNITKSTYTSYKRYMDVHMMRRALKKKYRVHAPFDPSKWISIIGPKIKLGAFPENGAMGEYFFDFGQADLFDPDTGEVTPNCNIDPGTIVLNHRALQSKAMGNSTICHEGIHHRFDSYYLMLQRTHGHSYASYLCKRYNKNDKQGDSKWSPIDIMELHANKLPGYIMIQDKPGKTYADKMMKSYGGEHTLQNLEQLVKDVASHFEVPLSMARRRLTELGYPDVDGISQYINNKRVPNHLSKLPPNQTYTIDEQDAMSLSKNLCKPLK